MEKFQKENKLLKGVLTSGEVQQLLSQLDLALADIYTDPKVPLGVHLQRLKDKYPFLIAAIKNDIRDTSGLEQFVRDIKEQLSKLEQVNLVLAFEPPQGFIDKLRVWLEKNLPGAYVLEISVDSSIGGGVIVEYKGRRLDLGLHTKLTNYFNVNKDAILSEL